MKRYAIESLKKWKNSENRKPLMLFGARQTGKTWLMKEFGHTCYKNVIYLNFDENKEHRKFFQDNLDTSRIIKALSYQFKTEINPEDTLIILDEIQECQRAKDALKYFCENAPQYHIIAAGSFLGVAAGKFPVGKVDRITLYPMSFYEFLEAIEQQRLIETLKEQDSQLLEPLSDMFLDLLRSYFYVGGMPAAVGEYIKKNNLEDVRRIQNQILKDYKDDFFKHIKGTDMPKVRMLWDSIPVHLAKEKKKFIYKEIKTGGRASEFENAMNWLVNTGLVYKVPRTLTARMPLSRNEDREVFKLYMLDVGLLCAKTDLDLAAFYMDNSAIFKDFNGALTEQYVCQQLNATYEKQLYYWGREKGMAEVDFLMQLKNEIIPIEVKSAYNTRSLSLDVYMDINKPKIAVKTSLRNLGKAGNLHSIPLYMIESLGEIIGGY